MWKHGTMNGFGFSMKQYELGSVYGINGGRISKLEIRDENGMVANYDRGWDLEPETKEAKAALAAILARYN